ncbi:MAG TPA: phosphatidate cytidylyltransferase [bacterium]|nr:phosphatidate cytidylyltransferase [bacterium]
MEEKAPNFLLRTLSGLVWAGVFLFCAWYGSTWRWVILMGLCVIGGVYEMRNLTREKGKAADPFLSGLGALVILAGAWFRGVEGLAYGSLAAVLVNALTVLRRRYEGALEIFARSVLTSFYLGLGTGAAVLLGHGTRGGPLLVVTLAALWIADTGAYIVGSLFGRHQLAPHLSPKKTVEGLVAGVVLAAGGALTLETYLLNAGIRGRYILILGVVVALAALLGDLAVSAIKRDAGLKDTGSIVPGHGGLLDRLDSFLLVMPAVCLYLISLQHIGLWNGTLG